MRLLRGMFIAVTLLGCATGATAREFPIELVKPYYGAIEKACSRKDPANARRFRTGLKRMLAKLPEAETAVVNENGFPDYKARIRREIAQMPEQELLQECNHLYEYADPARR